MGEYNKLVFNGSEVCGPVLIAKSLAPGAKANNKNYFCNRLDKENILVRVIPISVLYY